MERRPIERRLETLSWKTQLRRVLCVIMQGHKFPPNLGKRSDLVCLRCGIRFYTEKAYRKGKR
jgi:hypothetical protein